MNLSDISDLISDLQGRLDKAADPQTKIWFENYLKHSIQYRGVKTPEVTRILGKWRNVHDLQQVSEADQLTLAAALIRQEYAEDKFAGTLYIQKYLLKKVEMDSLLAKAEDLFSSGAFFDWSTTDWFCVRVLGPAIVHHGLEAGKRVAGWCEKSNLWHRRASIVPFRGVVRDEAYHQLIKSTIAILVKEQERFIQTGVGWVISDLSKVYPREATALVECHFDRLSAEVIRRHTKYLPDHKTYKARKRNTK
ncbi:MAG: DNA alkylation repair protein [Bacteroidetes bacterium]|nr:DNA alkylation repair protein [Bacteroidota bacterium]MCY4204770.1 DNA alkylation repair protein [Bacteroidota bacterium]